MSTVKVARVVDPRIDPQPDPFFLHTIAPSQDQYYTLPASGLSNSSITFNNITTLGTERAFLDTFELGIIVDVTFHLKNPRPDPVFALKHNTWTWDSFPLNKCADEIRVNVNGGAFFSHPMSYLRAKERFWDDAKLNESYGNVCPCNKPWVANEECQYGAQFVASRTLCKNYAPTRVNRSNVGYGINANGSTASSNNDINPKDLQYGATPLVGNQELDVTYTFYWREPIFASPFSSRYDETFGRPLYNITSIDIVIALMNLGNMIRTSSESYIDSYTVNLKNVDLLYEVCTVPAGFTPPAETVIPYRRIVPYSTEAIGKNPIGFARNMHDCTEIDISSGQYTLGEIPDAITIYLGPTKRALQENEPDGWDTSSLRPTDQVTKTYSFNKLAARLEHISISMANTTQILNTATPYDLYRIAKRNGCKDSFTSWYREVLPVNNRPNDLDSTWHVTGAGSYLRLIPGSDIRIDQPLVPGTNANNMVMQVNATFNVPPTWPPNYRDVALWILFEYVGVARITPGQCFIDMNPLKDGAAIASSPVVTTSAIDSGQPSALEGSGWLDKLKSVFKVANKVAKDTGILSKALTYVPTIGPALSTMAKSMGYGYGGGGRKRPAAAAAYDIEPPPVSGGAIMGLGDFI